MVKRSQRHVGCGMWQITYPPVDSPVAVSVSVNGSSYVSFWYLYTHSAYKCFKNMRRLSCGWGPSCARDDSMSGSVTEADKPPIARASK